MDSTYRSNLSKQLRADKQKIEAFQAHLNRRPLNIPVKLDLRGAMTQAAALRKAILGEFARLPATILGADGRPASAGASGVKSMNQRAGVLSDVERQVFSLDAQGNRVTETFRTLTEQIGKGLTQVNKFKDGSGDPFETITKDVSNVRELETALRGMNSQLRETYGRARGQGDKAGQIAALNEHRSRLNQVLLSASANGLANSPAYDKAENQIARIGERIASLEGGQVSATARKARQERSRQVGLEIGREYRLHQERLKGNKIEETAAQRITDKTARESELNRVYAARKKIHEESRDAFRGMDAALQAEGRPDLADRAMRAGLVQHNQANQTEVERARMETGRVQAAAKEQERASREAARKAEQAKRLADAAAKRSGNLNFNRGLRLDDHATKLALRANEADEAAAKAIPDRIAREAELNRVLAERKRIHEDSAQRLGTMQSRAETAGNMEHAAKAEAAKLKSLDSASKAHVGQIRADATAQNDARKEAEAAVQKSLAKAHADRQAAYQREFQDIKSASEKRIAQINAAERTEKNATKSASEKSAAAAKAHSLRQSEYGARAANYSDVESRARRSGHVAVADTARGKRLGAEVSAVRDQERFAAATTKSGHALDFHSSSLLRNAGTFLKWQIPMQAVMKTTQAFTSGFAGAIKVNRQFATLRAVFNGTEQEAQKLKVGTLDLATAQGRSADEAMDASIRWSRLGFTRIQVLEATKVSLQAANVAEITASEATEKLAAIYATFRLNVGDLGTVLNRLNSISNNYNVTVDDMFEGIVRVGGVAKQSGLALRDLEGMIGAVVGATGRPGAEVGNALKFVVTRLASPEIMEALKKSFDIDLTQPNGDLKDMSQIFRQLAEIYPTLNSAQQQYFLKLTAGSRQSARFALILDQYRQGQILAAGAAFDTSSAYAENQKIIESLQSRIESLKTSWTELFTAMGDSGAFERVGGFLKYVQGLVMEITGNIDEAVIKARNIAIKDAVKAETVERFGGGDKMWFGTRDSFSKEELDKTIKTLEEGVAKQQSSNPLKFLDRSGDGSFDIYSSLFGESKNFKSVKDAQKFIDELKEIRKSGGDTGATDEVARMTSGVNSLRERLGGLERAAGVFDSLDKAIEKGSVDRKTLIRDFEGIAALLPNMENGAEVYGQAVERFYEALDSGDMDKVRELMRELGAMFKRDASTTRGNYANQMEPVVQALRDRQIAIEKQQREAKKMPQGTALERTAKDSLVKKLADDAKTTTAAIEQLTQGVEEFKQVAYNELQVSNIGKYLDDVLAQAAAVGEAMKELAPDAENDPIDRIFLRKRNAHGKLGQVDSDAKNSSDLGVSWLRDIQRQTNAQSDLARKAAEAAKTDAAAKRDSGEITLAQYDAEIELQDQIIQKQNEADLMVQARIDTETTRIEQLMRELDFQQQIAILARTQTDASKRAANSSRAWRVGETDSDKDSNEARAALQRAAATINAAESAAANATPADKANFTGSVLQDEATARANLNAMEQRNYDLDAARRQVAIDTAKAMREQTEEAAKRLQMASREDQLRASVIARTIRDRGPIKSNEFFALSQDTRQAIVNYNPNAAPDSINPAKETSRKASREITEEQLRLSKSIDIINKWMSLVSERITKDTGRGGALDPIPPSPSKPVQNAANPTTRDGSPVVNIQLGDVTISVRLADQVERLMTGYVDRKIASDLSAMEQRLRSRPVPTSQGATER